MYNTCDVQAALKTLPITENRSEELLEYCCERAVTWVKSRLRENVEDTCPLILTTMVAMAEFFLSSDGGSETDSYDTYSVGDLTFRRNCEREMKVARMKRDEALALASGILKDGDFYVRAT